MSTTDKDDFVCLITGASSGIGRAAALKLAEEGARLILVNRSEERGEDARREIIEQSDNEEVQLFPTDLARQREVRELARIVRSRYDHLDVLINNAGVYLEEGTLTEDGIEKTFAVNHLSHFLLTNLLLDLIKESAPARIINVSSNAHRGVDEIDEDSLRGPPYNGLKAYAQSKLANVLFTCALANRLEGTGVTVNAVNPGMVTSSFWKNKSNILGRVMQFFQPFMADADESGEALRYLAVSPEFDDVSGKYFDKKNEVDPSSASRVEANASRLWELSEEMTGLA
jgi:NAD(P)-dependent dehydrogenase (short-subunit alcohol dehydrogenase family)